VEPGIPSRIVLAWAMAGIGWNRTGRRRRRGDSRLPFSTPRTRKWIIGALSPVHRQRISQRPAPAVQGAEELVIAAAEGYRACSGGCGSSRRSRRRNLLGWDPGGLRPLASPIPRAVPEQRCRSLAELIPSGLGCLTTRSDDRPDMSKRRAAQHPYWQTPAPPARPG
jgi:hypothetical protein